MPGRRTNDELRAFIRRLGALGGAIVLIVLLGAVGFVLTEDVGAWDGFVWSLDTVATVGSIPGADTTGGQLVKVALIVTGVGTLFYALVTITEFFVAGHLGELFEERRMERMTASLSDHTIICGYGRVGRQVARDLGGAGAAVVVIDEAEDAVARARDDGALAIRGSASDDEVLREAGIGRARAIIACVDSDAENVFITLSARELRAEGLLIVARAGNEEAERKLRRAGADRVVSPYKTSGAELARLAQHPQISGALDISPGYRLDEIDVTEGCPGAGCALADVRGDAVVVGLRRNGRLAPSPPEDTRVEAGDVVVAMGSDAAMVELERRFDPARAASRD